MFSKSLRSRFIVTLVIIVTLTSTLFAGGVILIKQQLEAVIFGNMVRDQLQVLLSQLDDNHFSETSLFENWDFYHDESVRQLDPVIASLDKGSHHSVVVADRYYQVEVAEHEHGKVYLSYDITEWEHQEHRTLELLAYGIGFVLLAAVFMGWQASRVVLAPVNRLAREVSGIHPRERNVRFSERYQGNEISVIAQAFDSYLERLDRFVERERSFTAAASHELRTPLSVMMGAVDVLESQPQNPASGRALSRISRACAEMQAFIEATMFLSREDSSTIEQGEPADLTAIIHSLLEDNDSKLQQQNLKVILDIGQGMTLDKPDSIVRIMISNILRNAIEHTRDGEIRISLSDGQLTISDSGEGIPKSDLPHVYDRSYTTKKGGTGLGLNLVKRICDRFNWQISINSEEGRGTQVCVRFTNSNEVI